MAKPDVFDRLFSCRFLKRWFPLWGRYREVALYLLFGGLTTVVSIGSFWLCNSHLQWNEHVANTVSWLLAVLFAFFTNRLWVFRAPVSGAAAFARQLLLFYSGRLATFAVEELVILVFITWLGFPGLVVKIAGQVLVLVLNYVVSKCLVFRRDNASPPSK